MEAGLLRTMIFGIVVATVIGLGFFGALALLLAKLGWRKIAAWEVKVAKVAIACTFAGLLCIAYGALIEADWLSETRIEVSSSKIPAGIKIRIVHLSDLHVLEHSKALRELPARVNALKPDLLVFTGDSIADKASAPILKEVLKAIDATRIAVRGNHDVWYFRDVDLFGDGAAIELSGTATRAAGLIFCGADYEREHRALECLRRAEPGFRVVALHTPDFVEDFATLENAPDLYLAGHTHGGQVRLPFYGAVLTMSKFDKKYEMGRFQVGPTTLFVSRGVGFEPPPAPRVRFLCRPEIAVIDVVGQGNAP